MSVNPQPEQNPGTPQIFVQIPDKFGGQKVQQFKPDSNRLNPVSEFRFRMLEMLAVPARPVDQALQAVSWIAVGAFTSSLLRWVPLSPEFLIPIGLVILVCCAIGAYSATFEELAPFLAIRNFLLVIGAVLGVLL